MATKKKAKKKTVKKEIPSVGIENLERLIVTLAEQIEGLTGRVERLERVLGSGQVHNHGEMSIEQQQPAEDDDPNSYEVSDDARIDLKSRPVTLNVGGKQVTRKIY